MKEWRWVLAAVSGAAVGTLIGHIAYGWRDVNLFLLHVLVVSIAGLTIHWMWETYRHRLERYRWWHRVRPGHEVLLSGHMTYLWYGMECSCGTSWKVHT